MSVFRSLVVGFLVVILCAQIYSVHHRPQWTYTTIVADGFPHVELGKAADAGWEYVEAIPSGNGKLTVVIRHIKGSPEEETKARAFMLNP